MCSLLLWDGALSVKSLSVFPIGLEALELTIGGVGQGSFCKSKIYKVELNMYIMVLKWKEEGHSSPLWGRDCHAPAGHWTQSARSQCSMWGSP